MATTSMDSPVTCTVCGGYDDETHKERQHPFTGPDQPDWVPPKTKREASERQQGEQGPAPQMVILPAPDFALRAVLMDKGIITQEELKEAENALRFPSGSNPVPPQ